MSGVPSNVFGHLGPGTITILYSYILEKPMGVSQIIFPEAGLCLRFLLR